MFDAEKAACNGSLPVEKMKPSLPDIEVLLPCGVPAVSVQKGLGRARSLEAGKQRQLCKRQTLRQTLTCFHCLVLAGDRKEDLVIHVQLVHVPP